MDLKNRMYRSSVREIFESRVYDALTISVHDDIYYLSHFPYQYFTGYNLHGHIHSGPRSSASERLPRRLRQYDVGVDNNNYFPINLEQIKLKLQENETRRD